MLTGDKSSTAKIVAHNSNIINADSSVEVITEEKLDLYGLNWIKFTSMRVINNKDDN